MSDYQFVHFLAMDRPLDDEQLAFMREQSQSTKVTHSEFIDEYGGEYDGRNFFQGNHWDMLQQGYDACLNYCSFAIRDLEFHLPGGPPCGQKLLRAFVLAGGGGRHFRG